MNLDFKILWFDDQSIDAHKRLIETFLKEEYELRLIVNPKKGNEDISTIDIDSYDLILMDYGLIGNETGVSKYQEIRSRFNYVDIAFYSTTMKQCKEELKELEKTGIDIEGVYYLEVNNDTLFEEKIQSIIAKIVKRSESISNLRGLFLSETATFDCRIRAVSIYLINKYKLHLEINKYLDQNIHKDICNTYNRDEKKYGEIKCKIGYYLDSSLALPKLEASKQVRLLNKVLKLLEEKGVCIDTQLSDFNSKYSKEIIDYRNAFAHKKEENGTLVIKTEQIIVDETFHKQMRSRLAYYSSLLDIIEKI